MTRALVLAGGGLAGIAWETGVLLGICDEAPEAGARLLSADVLCSIPVCRRTPDMRWQPSR